MSCRAKHPLISETMAQHNDIQETARIDALFERISGLIEQTRKHVVTAANIAEVYTKFCVGLYIVEDEHVGETRAQYGKQILKGLSNRLTTRFGRGWSVDTLENCRTFYLVYSKSETPLRNSHGKTEQIAAVPQIPISETLFRKSVNEQSFTLSWSHYLVLMRIENPDARSFYEIECAEQQWSVRQLSRQVGSSLYERLALSRNKDEVMRLAKEGQTIEKPTIGILLCESKKDSLVQLTLPKDANIYAAQYQLYLPDKALLQAKVKDWIQEYKEQHPDDGNE